MVIQNEKANPVRVPMNAPLVGQNKGKGMKMIIFIIIIHETTPSRLTGWHHGKLYLYSESLHLGIWSVIFH